MQTLLNYEAGIEAGIQAGVSADWQVDCGYQLDRGDSRCRRA